MITIKCTLANGKSTITRITGTLQDAQDLFLGKEIDVSGFGIQKCIKVERIEV